MLAILWVKELILISILSIGSMVDALAEKVPWGLINTMIFAGVALHLLQKDLLQWDTLLALIPGIICLLITQITHGGLGNGDSWLILAMGLLMSAQEVLLMGIVAFLLANLVMRLVLKKDAIAFLPFLMAGFIFMRGMELCGFTLA